MNKMTIILLFVAFVDSHFDINDIEFDNNFKCEFENLYDAYKDKFQESLQINPKSIKIHSMP